MRFVPTFCLREGMTLGKNLYGRDDKLLLREGTTLIKTYIDGIDRLNYNGVYVIDDLSKDIEIINVISDSLRMETVKGIKDTFIHSEKGTFKPDKMYELQRNIENIIEEILENKNLMVNMVDLKVFDNYTYFHSVNVAVLSIVMGVALGLRKEALIKLGLGALLHDIGKVFVKKEILNKNEKLTDEEFKEMKGHSKFGFSYVKDKFDLPATVYVAILDHHEKYDGTGYPEGKKEDKISIFGRIIAIADVYDALTSDRPYRKAMPPSEAMEYIMGGSGSLFDPEFVMLFTRKIAPYPIGTCVKLSNREVGIVIENYETCCLRPKLRIFQKENLLINPFEVNLKDNHNYINITITDIAKI